MNSSILYKGEMNYSSFDKDHLFADLRLDQVLDEIIGKQDDVSVRDYFYQKPENLDDLTFRLEIIKELDMLAMRGIVQEFLRQHSTCKIYMDNSQTLSQRQTKQKWFFDAATIYCNHLIELRDKLLQERLKSEGLQRFLSCLQEYIKAPDFESLFNDVKTCAAQLDSIRYTIDINLNQNRVRISKDDVVAKDYIGSLAKAFSQYELSLDSRIIPFPGVNMGTLELSILEMLNDNYPDEFKMLNDFYVQHLSFATSFVDAFVHELQFYLQYIKYMDRLKEKGYVFSYPSFVSQKAMKIRSGYDLSLAQSENRLIATNDFDMDVGENFVITGPNQGGKTTYVRMLGQIAYFVSMGLPAPCKSIETYFIERIYTHFAQEEDLSTNFGRLKEELQRIKTIFETMPRNSMVIFNDLFASTTTYDALQMGRDILRKFISQGCLCLFVSHIHEMADAAPGIVSLYADVGAAQKTYQVSRGHSENKAFLNHLINKYQLQYNDIMRRVK